MKTNLFYITNELKVYSYPLPVFVHVELRHPHLNPWLMMMEHVNTVLMMPQIQPGQSNFKLFLILRLICIISHRCGKINEYQSVYEIPDEDLPWD